MNPKYPNCKSIPMMAHLKLDGIIPADATEDSMRAIRLKNLHELDKDVSDVIEYKIPPIIHMVWVTDKNRPNEIEDKYLQILQSNLKLLSNNKDVIWQFMLWVNDPTLIPHTVNSLAPVGVNVRSVDELITEQDLLSKVYELIDNKYYALASNSIRYSALREHGGIYMDTDYEVFKVPYKLMKTFDFVAGHIHAPPVSMCPENNMIMAKPHHPILEEMISLLRINLLDFEHASEPVKHACNVRHETALLGGSRVICPSFFKKNNQDGNVDVVFEDKVMTDDWRYEIIGTIPDDPYSEDYTSATIPLFGRDHYAGRWIPGEEMQT